MKDAYMDADILVDKLNVKKSYLERIMGLPQRSLSDKSFVQLPETQILLKMLYSMPWLVEVFEHSFNPEACQLILAKQYFEIKLKEKDYGKDNTK